MLDRLVSALIDTAMANRESGGLYRWEGRYLRGDDQATLIEQMRTVHRRIHGPLMAIRPELTSRQRWTLSTAVLSMIGSIVDHRAKLPAIQVRRLFTQISRRGAGRRPVSGPGAPPARRHARPALPLRRRNTKRC